MLKVEDLPIKMKVTPKQSELIQKAYFELGGTWASGFKTVLHTDCPFLMLGELDMGMTASKMFAVYAKRTGTKVDPLDVLKGTDIGELPKVNFLRENLPRVLEFNRERLGADDGDDEKYDLIIEDMSNHDLIGEYIAWQIGDRGWWDDPKSAFDELESFSKGEQE